MVNQMRILIFLKSKQYLPSVLRTFFVALIIFAVILLVKNEKRLFESQTSKRNVLGKNSKPSINISELLSGSADDISAGRYNIAENNLAVVLQFDPYNVYAARMIEDVRLKKVDLNAQINEMLDVVRKQPGWEAAWLRLALLYEQVGETELAKEAKVSAHHLNAQL